MTKILGISAFYHDSAAALIIDGEIIAAAQEERFTRIKHDSNYPYNAINYCLEEAGLVPNELDAVVYYEKPLIKFERILETIIQYAPKSLSHFVKGLPSWLNKKLFITNLIDKSFDKKLKCPIYFTTHHEAHAASAFYPSPFENAAFICIDAVGEWDTTSWGVGNGENLEFREKIEFPHSIGMLYSAFTGFLGFKVNSGEYKVMGLAPYGEGKYTQLILDNLIDLRPDGSFKLNMEYFGYTTSEYMYNEKFIKLFNIEPRKPESALEQVHMDIARSIQEALEIIIIKIANHVFEKTKLKNLCLAGGCALNCVINGKIIEKTPFENVWIQPASGDAGGALGSALAVYYKKFKQKRKIETPDSQKGSLLGKEYSNEEIKEVLDKIGAKYHKTENIEKEIAQYISQGKIIGNFQGRMEFGPRALGNRSILADARNIEMQKKLNLAIKKRESFRPFAPSCLEEDTEKIFKLKHSLKSPYMLICADITEEIRKDCKEDLKGLDKLKCDRSILPAITHVDYSARIQTVNQYNKRYYNIINEFKKISGRGCIVNTSFNVRGEPLVNTPLNAYECFMFTQMDILAIGDYLLFKEEQPELKGIEEYLKRFKLD
ncbi:MAG: carbamoyltransferase [Candidatus Gastranaerophilales bacterium]|nr:carbamoyltransferase [Candidatus Gastranaerophilales bacterium]